MVLGRRADVIVHHVHQVHKLDFLEARPLVLDGGHQGVDAPGQFHLFAVKEEEQLPRSGHGVHFLFRPHIAADDFRQRRVGAGNRHERPGDDAGNAAAVLGRRIGPALRADGLVDEVDDAFRICRTIRQDGLDHLVFIGTHPLDPGGDSIDVRRPDVRDDQVVEALVLDNLQDIRIVLGFTADDFGDDFLRAVHIAPERQFQLLPVAVRQLLGNVICRVQVHFRHRRQGLFLQDHEDNAALAALDGADAFFLEHDINGWHFHISLSPFPDTADASLSSVRLLPFHLRNRSTGRSASAGRRRYPPR